MAIVFWCSFKTDYRGQGGTRPIGLWLQLQKITPNLYFVKFIKCALNAKNACSQWSYHQNLDVERFKEEPFMHNPNLDSIKLWYAWRQ